MQGSESTVRQAKTLVARYFSRGESCKALHVLESLPETDLLQNPDLYMDYLWALLCERKFEQARIAREFFETNSYRILADVDADTVNLFATNAAVQSLLQFIFENDLNAISAEAMERVKAYLDVSSDYQFMVINIYAFLLFMNGRYEKARFFAVKAKMANAKQDDSYNYAISTMLIALSDRALGRYDIAIKSIDQTIGEYYELDESPAFSILLMQKAMLLYDRNRLDEAKMLITHALPNLGIPAITEFLVHGYLILAKIEIWEQRYSKASNILDELISKLDAAGYQRWSSAIQHEQIRIQLYQMGHPGQQPMDTSALPLNYYNSRYCPAVGHIPLRTKLMVALHQQQFEIAGHFLGQLSQVCLLQRDSMLRIVLLSSTAVLEFGKGHYEEACEYLNQALRASHDSGIIRALFDEVAGFEPLFKYAQANHLIDEDVDESLLYELNQVDFKSPNPTTATAKCDKSAAAEPAILESLTQTEQKILVLLCQGLPNKAIAAQCDINISTVKWHLKNIYSKLYVKNRTEAVLKAQQYQLVDSSTLATTQT